VGHDWGLRGHLKCAGTFQQNDKGNSDSGSRTTVRYKKRRGILFVALVDVQANFDLVVFRHRDVALG